MARRLRVFWLLSLLAPPRLQLRLGWFAVSHPRRKEAAFHTSNWSRVGNCRRRRTAWYRSNSLAACSPSAPASHWVAKGLACKWGRVLPIFWENYFAATRTTARCFWLPVPVPALRRHSTHPLRAPLLYSRNWCADSIHGTRSRPWARRRAPSQWRVCCSVI